MYCKQTFISDDLFHDLTEISWFAATTFPNQALFTLKMSLHHAEKT